MSSTSYVLTSCLRYLLIVSVNSGSYVQVNKGVEKKGAKLLSLEASAQAKAADAEAKQEARAEAKRKRQEEKQAEKAELKR